MSALNVLVLENAAHIWTDGQLTAPDGSVIAVAMPRKMRSAKVMPLPHMACAVATRGRWEHLWLFATIAGNVESAYSGYDGIRYFAQTQFRRSVEAAAVAPGDGPLKATFLAPFQLVVAGWSPLRREARAFYLSSTESQAGPAWQVVDIDYLFLGNTPVSPELQARLDDATQDPVATLHDVIDYQAKIDETIGEFAQHTIITRDEIVTRMVRDYRPKRLRRFRLSR